MKIRNYKNNQILIEEVPQIDFRYWDGFCEFFIQKCDQVLKNTELNKEEIIHFQMLKETLEQILFKIDVTQTDKYTVVEFESTYLAFFISMKERWLALLQQSINVQKEQLTSVKNGENKRQLFEEVEKNTYYITTGKKVLSEFAIFIIEK